MKTLRDLNAPPQVRGRVEAIIVRAAARASARSIEATMAIAKVGLAEDRLGQRACPELGRRGEAELSTRRITLIQQEHLPAIAQLARVASVDPVGLRRNLVISAINLLALKSARRRSGDALLEIVGPWPTLFADGRGAMGPGGYAAMRGHGGVTARTLKGRAIRVGDGVRVESPS